MNSIIYKNCYFFDVRLFELHIIEFTKIKIRKLSNPSEDRAHIDHIAMSKM